MSVKIPVEKVVIEYKIATSCYECSYREHIGYTFDGDMFCKHMKARKTWDVDWGIPA